ncbi:MAG: hypothetical protein RLZZ156_2803, partial [Deinococcota bacterium]
MFIDYALLIPLLPAFGWLIISLFSKSLGGKGSAWLATTMIGLSAVIAIGLFADAFSSAPVWKADTLGKIYKLEKEIHKLEDKEKAAKPETATVEPGSELPKTEGEHHASPELLALEEKLEEYKTEALESRAVGGFPFTRDWTWLAIKGEAGLPFGLYVDQLAAIMLLMVTIVCFLIHLFSIGYMAHEERYPTFFSYINLFAAAMLAMVLAKNLFHV